MNVAGFLHVANQFVTIVVFVLLIALAVRGIRRHRRASFALMAASITIMASITLYQSALVFSVGANQMAANPDRVREVLALSLNVFMLSGALLSVGLALEIAALMRGLKAAPSTDRPPTPPADSAGE